MTTLIAHVHIEGKRPLLWHAFGPSSLPLERQEKTGVAGNDPTEWEKTVLALPSGQLYLRPSYIFGCLRDGARYTKLKRGTLQPMLASTLQVMDDVILVDRYLPSELSTDPTQPVYLDIAGVRNPSTKGRNVRYRVAASPGWHTDFHLFWEATIVDRGAMQQVVHDAGLYVGLADGRSIGMGRFDLVSFEVEDGE